MDDRASTPPYIETATAGNPAFASSGGAETDLLLNFPDGQLLAIEVKRSLARLLNQIKP